MTPFVSSPGFSGVDTASRPADAGDRTAGNDARRLAWQREMERAQADTWFFGFRPAPVYSADKPRFGPSPVATSPIVPCMPGHGPDTAAASSIATSAAVSSGAAAAGASNSPHGLGKPGDAESSHAGIDLAASAAQAVPFAAVEAGRAIVDKPLNLPVAGWNNNASSLPGASSARSDSDTTAARAGVLTPPPEDQPAVDTAANLKPTMPDGSVPETRQASSAQGVRLPSVGRLADIVRAVMSPVEPIQLHVQWAGSSVSIWIGLSSSATASLPELIDSLTRNLNKHGLRVRSIVCNGVACYTQGSDREATSGSPTLDIQLITSKAKD